MIPTDILGSARTRVRGLAVPMLVLLAWEGVTRLHWGNPHLLVAPELVWAAAVELARAGELPTHVIASMTRDLLGLVIGASAGLVVGALMGVSRIADKLIGPTFHAAKQVAIFAWIPLMSVWFGTGETAKVLFIGLASFYPVVVNTYEGIRSIGREHLEVGRVLRFTRLQVARKIVIPGALPSILAGLHLAFIYAWLGTLGAEYLLAAAPGVGNLMIDGRERLAMDQVLVGVFFAGAIGLAQSSVGAQAESYLLRWRAAPAPSRS